MFKMNNHKFLILDSIQFSHSVQFMSAKYRCNENSLPSDHDIEYGALTLLTFQPTRTLMIAIPTISIRTC